MLAEGVEKYKDYFLQFRCSVVPENPGKLNFSETTTRHFFQASQEPRGMLKIFSTHEETVLKLRELLISVIDVKMETEVIRVFSPETLLMELYVPVMQMLKTTNFLSDVSTSKNLEQVLDEVREERFVHAIRATGIAVEELIVEIYETYIREKAPSCALGELLTSLQNRLKEIVHGQSKKNGHDFGDAKKAIGKFIEIQKKGAAPDPSLLGLCEVLQKNIVPLMEELGARATESSRNLQKEVKVVLFPPYVQRCVNELVTLRNRVSHRVEKIASSVTNVGYVEASLGLRAYVVLSSWWYTERGLINYKESRKKIVEESAARSLRLSEETDLSLTTSASSIS